MPKKNYVALHQNIHLWYSQYGRVTLPWRNTDNPYEIYLSEIMLQQTQVKTVLERFYFPFLAKFPSIKSIASASEDEILKAWEGLGYYSRARNLHKTAKLCGNVLPSTAEELVQLPGIGKSTAHAIACFAYHEALPILDANVKRILYRFFAITKCTDKQLWEKAYELHDQQNSYIYNQTLMDIGATVCRHKSPLCDQCPLNERCQGKHDPLRYPEKKKKKAKPINEQHIILYTYKEQYALNKNETRLLQGLWGFPQEEKHPNTTLNATELGKITHHYSHFGIKASVWLVKASPDTALNWFTLEQINELPLSGVDRKALSLLKTYLD